MPVIVPVETVLLLPYDNEIVGEVTFNSPDTIVMSLNPALSSKPFD